MEFIKNPQIIGAIIAFSGVIVGAIATGIITLLSDIIKFNRDETIYYKRKREEIYLEMQKFIIECESITNSSDHINVEKFNDINAKAKIYLKHDVSVEFYSLISNMFDTIAKDRCFSKEACKKFTKQIRKDLKIED